MDIFYIQEYVCVLLAGTLIRNDLHQIPAVILAQPPAVTASQHILPVFQGHFQMVGTGERNKIMHIVRMDAPVVNKLPEPA